MTETLKRTYQDFRRPQPNVWGKRPATPNEVAQVIKRVKGEVGMDDYPPTQKDIDDKTN